MNTVPMFLFLLSLGGLLYSIFVLIEYHSLCKKHLDIQDKYSRLLDKQMKELEKAIEDLQKTINRASEFKL